MVVNFRPSDAVTDMVVGIMVIRKMKTMMLTMLITIDSNMTSSQSHPQILAAAGTSMFESIVEADASAASPCDAI